MSGSEDVARHQTIQAQLVYLSRSQQLSSLLEISIARADDVEAGTHEIVGGAVRLHVEKAGPHVGVTAVARDVDAHLNRSGHLHVAGKRPRIERQHVVTFSKRPVVVQADAYWFTTGLSGSETKLL